MIITGCPWDHLASCESFPSFISRVIQGVAPGQSACLLNPKTWFIFALLLLRCLSVWVTFHIAETKYTTLNLKDERFILACSLEKFQFIAGESKAGWHKEGHCRGEKFYRWQKAAENQSNEETASKSGSFIYFSCVFYLGYPSFMVVLRCISKALCGDR